MDRIDCEAEGKAPCGRIFVIDDIHNATNGGKTIAKRVATRILIIDKISISEASCDV